MGEAWDTFKRYSIILCRGLYRSSCGASTASLLVLAVHGFGAVPTEGGWAAVTYFVISVTALALFGVCVYHMGKGGKNA